MLERGPVLEHLENVAASGTHVASLDYRPDANLPPELVFILRQFTLLNMQRPQGMGGVSAIPLHAIESFWRIYLKDDDILPLQEFADWITALDEVAMEHAGKTESVKKSNELPSRPDEPNGRRTLHSRGKG